MPHGRAAGIPPPAPPPEPPGHHGRPSRPPGDAPPAYTPPPLDTTPPHPDVTTRASWGNAAREITMTAVKGPRAWAYGHQRIAGKVQYIHRQYPNIIWMVIELWKGPSQLIKCTSAGVDVSTLPGITVTYHSGTPSGTVDTGLAAIDTSWNEAFPGTTHAVVQLWDLDKHWPQMPNLLFEALVGTPIDPRTGVAAAMGCSNPYVQWYDWLLDPEGKALTTSGVNTAAFAAAANIADQAVGSRHRFESHMQLLAETNPDDVIKSFALLCNGLWFWNDANQFDVICDQAGSVAATYDDSVIVRSQKVKGYREDDTQKPNKVILNITDTTNDWKQLPVTVTTPALDSGAEDEFSVTYEVPWVQDQGIAKDIGTYILYGYVYDMKLQLLWNATAASSHLGDIVQQTVSARGMTFTGRIVGRSKLPNRERYAVTLLEYNAARYSSTIGSAAAKTASTLPDPGDTPPDVTLSTVTITEELFFANRKYDSRARIVINNPSFYFLDAVELWYSINGGDYRFYSDFPGGSGDTVDVMFDSVNELNVPYSFKFITRSKFGPKSAGVTSSKTFVGKTTPPADPPSAIAGANQDHVVVLAQPSPDRDVVLYEWRRGTSSDTWSTAHYVAQTDSPRLVDAPPYGAIEYFVKAIDCAGNYSANAATAPITFRATAIAPTTTPFPAFFSTSNFTVHAQQPRGQGGVWYGSGNLISEVVELPMLPSGSHTKPTSSRTFLCRNFTPTTAESERSSGGYSSVGAWAAAVDDPRRGGAPLWAPLPANASGEIYGQYNEVDWIHRLSEYRMRFLAVQHRGVDIPANIPAPAPFIFDSGNNIKSLLDIFNVTPNGSLSSAYGSLYLGVHLSTNSPYYQQVIQSAVAAGVDGSVDGYVWSLTRTPLRKRIVSGNAVTDGTGQVQVSYSYPDYAALPADAFDVTATPNGTADVTVIPTSIDTVNNIITFKSFGSAGSLTGGVSFRFEAYDSGRDASGFSSF